MRKDFGAQSWMFPMPVLIVGTYDEAGVPDAMNAAWGGIHNTNQVAICIDHHHKTAANLLASGAFTVSFGDAEHVLESDFVGIVSANQVPDKVSRAGFRVRRSEKVNAPVFENLPVVLECRLVAYSPETECAIGDIVNVSADERVLDENGQISLEKFAPLCFDPVSHTYRRPGEVVGRAFCDGKKLKD